MKLASAPTAATTETGRIDANHFVRLTATNPAKLFGL